MGFRPQRDTVVLKFENPEHPLYGLEIKTRMPTVGAMLDSIDALEMAAGQRALGEATSDDVTPEYVASVRAQATKPFEQFAALLLEWNMEDQEPPHDPIPPTVEGFRRVASRTMALILREWRTRTMGVADDLKDDSNSGEISPMPDIPMEAL